jgi:hypothetical protein
MTARAVTLALDRRRFPTVDQSPRTAYRILVFMQYI